MILDTMNMKERTLSYHDFMESVEEGGILVDLRDDGQTQFGGIPGAVRIPATQLWKLYELPEQERIYLYCQKGEISGEILELMADAGYDAYELEGGYLSYLQNMSEP